MVFIELCFLYLNRITWRVDVNLALVVLFRNVREGFFQKFTWNLPNSATTISELQFEKALSKQKGKFQNSHLIPLPRWMIVYGKTKTANIHRISSNRNLFSQCGVAMNRFQIFPCEYYIFLCAMQFFLHNLANFTFWQCNTLKLRKTLLSDCYWVTMYFLHCAM